MSPRTKKYFPGGKRFRQDREWTLRQAEDGSWIVAHQGQELAYPTAEAAMEAIRKGWAGKKRHSAASRYRDLAIQHARPISMAREPKWRRAMDAFVADPSLANRVALAEAESVVRARRRGEAA